MYSHILLRVDTVSCYCWWWCWVRTTTWNVKILALFIFPLIANELKYVICYIYVCLVIQIWASLSFLGSWNSTFCDYYNFQLKFWQYLPLKYSTFNFCFISLTSKQKVSEKVRARKLGHWNLFLFSFGRVFALPFFHHYFDSLVYISFLSVRPKVFPAQILFFLFFFFHHCWCYASIFLLRPIIHVTQREIIETWYFRKYTQSTSKDNCPDCARV